MIKRIFLIVCTFTCMYAHSQGILIGKVIGNDSQPVQNVRVWLIQNDTSIMGTYTDRHGHFILMPVPLGKYDMRIKYMIYDTYTIEGIVEIKSDTIIILDDIKLIFTSKMLEDVEKKMSFRGYSGGMMLHTGYLSGGVVNTSNPLEKTKIQGMSWGVGGCLRFHFGKHLRIGGEGYNSTLHYGKNKSYIALSWGGLLADCQWRIDKFTVFLGGTIGGGSVKNITVLDNSTTGKNAAYRKYPVMVATPFVGMEYTLTPRLRLIAKADHVFSISKRQPDFATGIHVYAGVVFCHGK